MVRKRETKKTSKNEKEITTMEELTRIFGEGAAKAVTRNCKKRKLNYEQFLFKFILEHDDDAFSDFLYELCEKYHIPMYDEDENEG